MIRTLVLLTIAIFGVMMASFAAQAGCSLVTNSVGDQPSGTIITANISLSPSAIQMPKDITVGTELYRITARNNRYEYYRVNCNNSPTASNYYVKGQFVGGATPARSSWQGSSLGSVYATGVDGIGMVILTSTTNQALGDKKYSFGTCYTSNNSCNTVTSNGDITFVLIKTGEITASSVDLTALPKVETLVGGTNSPGSDFAVFRPSLTGTLTFTQPTCTLAEASKTVELGEHKVSDFAAANATTPWVKASIDLINCNYGGPQSYSYNILKYSSSSTVTTVASPITTNAIWSLSLTPATSVIDDTNGIMAISSGSGNATGIGIQLSSSNTTLQAIKFSQPTTGIMVSGTNATMTIPLYARYIKTDSTVTAGKANGKLTYLVEYK